VFRPRYNRYIGVSREGTICFSWLKNQESIGTPVVPIKDVIAHHNTDTQEDSVNNEWELKKGPAIFQGIFLLLAIHVQGEKVILQELSNTLANASEFLKKIFLKHDTLHIVDDEDIIHENVGEPDDSIIELTIDEGYHSTSNIGNEVSDLDVIHEPFQKKKNLGISALV